MTFRPIELEDIRYLYAAYKQGGLAAMGESFADGSMGADEFKEAFQAAVMGGCHAAWVLFAPTKRGEIPVGVVFGQWATARTYIDVIGGVWMPWASKRNIVEAVVYFLDKIRKEFRLMIYALPEHRRLYEVCAQHGIIRRAGTSFIVVPGKVCSIWETRSFERAP